MIFTKGKGKLNKARIGWEWEKEEILEYTQKQTILRTISEIKSLVKKCENINEIRTAVNDNEWKITQNKSKVNDSIDKVNKYTKPKHSYIFHPKALSTLWGCRPHNHQGYNIDTFNVKHPTVKPIQIMERLIEMATSENQIVLDPFMGSGTTGIACQNLSRQFVGFELFPEYFDIAKQRLSNNSEKLNAKNSA